MPFLPNAGTERGKKGYSRSAEVEALRRSDLRRMVARPEPGLAAGGHTAETGGGVKVAF